MPASETPAASGTSMLPAARVKRIIKEDKDIFACGAESLFLISRATEYFIDSIVRESYEFSRLDKRKTVQYKDMAKAVQSIEQYDFLADIIPPTVVLRKPLPEPSKTSADTAAVSAENETQQTEQTAMETSDPAPLDPDN
ncbi:hypothetical protein J3B02_004249 [Coemansia erecta]|uniref:Transcription factor CBF/NF-Y/archaeal histone domain-containing protein n=1 Tax=Coemansia asiatica TaxID=1052880 RepID=A0A9W7XKX1_9FUNG|nr:hypothetical protein LPJ64_003094 [Coemansia asiatica]KAJ2847090.1 hypothetical protein J3B02_004249 [Coemansia erecta]